MIRVHVDPAFSEKLNRASVTRRCYPWDAIDWSVPIDDAHLYMPEEFSFLAGTVLWERLAPPARSFVTRWEATQTLRNVGVGEHILNQALLALVRHTNPYDPAWRYMLHEVAEECQHMAMFNAWIRINPDIRTKGLADDRWGLVASVLTPVIATRFPVLLWLLTLLLEVAGDDLGRAQARNESGLLHPIIEQMGRAHLTEEARHIAFARHWVEQALPRLTRLDRRLLAEVAERLVDGILWLGLLPLPYSRQLERFVAHDEFHAALRSSHRRAMLRRQLAPTVESLAELGVVRPAALRRWRKAGLVARAA